MHRAVLLQETIENLKLAPGKTIVDCTLGCGGHARAILERITPDGKLIGIDRDKDALEKAAGSLENYKKNISFVHGNFRHLDSILREQKTGKVDGIIFDLGLSSLQLEKAERGFSIKHDGPLDMRMDRSSGMGAARLVNTLRETEILKILSEFGEERFSGRITRSIVAKRPIRTTRQLAEIVSMAVPPKARHGRIHPATRTFQALRIAVNDELGALGEALDLAVKLTAASGRICVISFHSLEDRMVKTTFRELKEKGTLSIITKKPIAPKEEEVLINPRSRSAKLRVAEKL